MSNRQQRRNRRERHLLWAMFAMFRSYRCEQIYTNGAEHTVCPGDPEAGR